MEEDRQTCTQLTGMEETGRQMRTRKVHIDFSSVSFQNDTVVFRKAHKRPFRSVGCLTAVTLKTVSMVVSPRLPWK